ncbi:MAG: sulfate adenylyltransferase [Alphaproteobacteria bacterium]|nr:sulfate adenylyltransferase [Alphaproteobacteria bacterium]HCP00632.1 sulfate adenylyltransferase [Rhodospirillaceae bacterium]
MNRLDILESRSIYILREAYACARPLAMLWSIGKDSNVVLWLARKAFFGKVPFPVVQLDTGMELDEVYAFRDQYAAEWGLNLIVINCPPENEMDPSLPPMTRSAARKSAGLANLLRDGTYKGILVGIRRDEEATRAKERVFSPRATDGAWKFRDQPAEFWDQFTTDTPENAHLRVHPLLHWTEIDVWRYTQRENIPVNQLYFSQGGKRYRSLGEKNITAPIESNAGTIDEIIKELEITTTPERAGRLMDNESEDSFERLRTSGYM